MTERLPHEVRPFLGMKNFIGYFLDNEPAWNPDQVFEFYLGLGQERPGSRAFIAYLSTYYQGRIDKLNRDWKASYANFESIAGASPPKPYPLPMRQGFLKAWRTEVAVTYYRRYAAMVRALDPHHLILGIRHQGVPDIEFFKALTPYFDVNSINDYNRYGHLKPPYAELYRATGKPIIITEFSFSGFPQPGHKSSLFIDVYTQENRGIGYRKYVLHAARAPFMLGMHWFMWQDYNKQDPTIHGFPPDENVGLVSDDETLVYEELGRWIRRTNAEIEAAHRSSQMEAPARHGRARRTLKRFVPIVDGDLSEWPEELAIKPRQITALRDEVRVDHTYFISWDRQDVYLDGDISDSRLNRSTRDWHSEIR
jgi:agarase